MCDVGGQYGKGRITIEWLKNGKNYNLHESKQDFLK